MAWRFNPPDREEQPREEQTRRQQRTRANARQISAGEKVPNEFSQRDQDPGNNGDGGEDRSQEEELVGYEQQNRRADKDAINCRGDTVEREPEPLSGTVGGAVGSTDAPDVFFDEVIDVLAGPLGKVGNLQQIGQDVVTIVSQQGVSVEQKRRDARDEHYVVADGVYYGS